ncbi:PseG/SpsG family protein [Algibacter sp. L3A6]|uniref:PseG/SpsG family protein n=1 Tax=Algibacter sp. L3A6 TaxID=2686366 RepID=UPI00131ACA65|nr:hypothetical protein [Algibacter sp. L3A6]
MKNINSICFLVNGNQKIGLGHVYRSITIATEAIKRGVSTSFVFQENPIIQELLQANNIPFKVVKEDVWKTPKTHIHQYRELLKSEDVVVLDLLEKEFLKFNFLPEFEIKMVSITSFYYSEETRYEDLSFFPGMEIKTNPFIQNKYKKTKLLSGPKYLTFRDEFLKNFSKEFNEVTPEILVTMGGSDAFGFTPIVVKALLNLDFHFKATVILGTAATTFNEVEQLASNSSNIIIKKSVNNIADLMFNSTCAIINGGLTRYELALTGTPFIALSIHKMQYNITERVTELVGGVNLGIVKNLYQDDITKAIKDLILNREKRKSISKALQKTIDDKGTSRILDCIENIE